LLEVSTAAPAEETRLYELILALIGRLDAQAGVLGRPGAGSGRSAPRWNGAWRPRRRQACLDAGTKGSRTSTEEILLARAGLCSHGGVMFCVDEATAEAIRRVFDEEGELSAVLELRRHFPLITDNARGGNACGSSRDGGRRLRRQRLTARLPA